jgi:hypothetical protein
MVFSMSKTMHLLTELMEYSAFTEYTLNAYKEFIT